MKDAIAGIHNEDPNFIERAIAVGSEVRSGAIQKINEIFNDPTMSELSTRGLDLYDTMRLVTFTKEKMNSLVKDMPEQNRAQNALGRSKSQIDNRLMTATLTSGTSPAEVIKQCLAQIESKRQALAENQDRINKSNLWLSRMDKEIYSYKDILEVRKRQLLRITKDIEETERHIEGMKVELVRKEQHTNVATVERAEIRLDEVIEKRANKKIEIAKLENKIRTIANEMIKRATGIGSSIVYVEGCIKEIASFNELYKNVCRKYGWKIGEWDEEDLMNAEIHSKLRLAFTHAKHDIHANGVVGNGTQFWIEGLGIPVTTVAQLTQEHLMEEHELYKQLNRKLPAAVDPDMELYLKNTNDNPPIIVNGFILTHPDAIGVRVGFKGKDGFINGILRDIQPDYQDSGNSILRLVLGDGSGVISVAVNDIDIESFGYVTRDISIEFQEQWLDRMYERFKYSWRPVAERLGLTSLVNNEFAYINENKAQLDTPKIDFSC